MTLPSVVNDLLMLAPSFSLCPVAPVELARSDPAKSTKLDRNKRTYAFSEKCGLSYRLTENCSATHLIRDTFSVSRLVLSSRLFIVKRRVNTA